MDREKISYLLLGFILLAGFSSGAYLFMVKAKSKDGIHMSSQVTEKAEVSHASGASSESSTSQKAESEEGGDEAEGKKEAHRDAISEETHESHEGHESHETVDAHESHTEHESLISHESHSAKKGHELAESEVQMKFQIALNNGRSPSAVKTAKVEKSEKSHLRGPSGPALTWKDEDFLLVDPTSVDGGVCQRVEYRGDSYHHSVFQPQDWKKVSNLFQSAKDELLNWTIEAKAKLPEKTLQWMQNRMKKLRLVPLPYASEPDLAWRGIGIYLKTEKGDPVVHLGTGFVRLAVRQPGRALFELTRLAAQAWAPLEFEKSGAEMPWTALLDCLGISSSDTVSERSWAVSSSLAVLLNPPGCTLPIFQSSDKAGCISKISPSSVATGGEK